MKFIDSMPTKPFFTDRNSAGRAMSFELGERYKDKSPVVLGIPRGGVLVAAPIAETLGVVPDVVTPRKIPIPDNPEMGFGAVTSDGTTYLNKSLAEQLMLRDDEIKELAEEVRREVVRRDKVYRGDRPFPDVTGKTVLVVDDGLATGYTMLAALRSLKKLNPGLLVSVTPVSPLKTLEIIEKEADEVAVMVVQETGGFAVASFYKNFKDPTDDEVLKAISETR